MVNFTRLPEEELRRIYVWRNLDYVRRAMDNQDPFTFEDHLAFCKSLAGRRDKYYFQVRIDGIPCGVLDYQDVDMKAGTAQCGFYVIREFDRFATVISRTGNLLAFRLGLKRLFAHVLKSNGRAVMYNLVKRQAQYDGEDEKYVYCSYPVFEEDPEHNPFYKTHKCNTFI